MSETKKNMQMLFDFGPLEEDVREDAALNDDLFSGEDETGSGELEVVEIEDYETEWADAFLCECADEPMCRYHYTGISPHRHVDIFAC